MGKKNIERRISPFYKWLQIYDNSVERLCFACLKNNHILILQYTGYGYWLFICFYPFVLLFLYLPYKDCQ